MIHGEKMDWSEVVTEINLPSGFRISDRYEVMRYIGSGATGSVFVAKDCLLEDAIVAIKVLRMSAAKSHDQIKRFLREVKLMNSVNHPNVVRTFDAGTDRDLIYFTMEYIEGTSLEDCANTHNLSYEEIKAVLVQICLGLEAIHEADIIHRDLKPGNIMLDHKQHVKIADFGVARPSTSSLTQTGSILGSFEYMAPEVWDSLPPTPLIDLYSLGVILYELVVGHPPFYASVPGQIMRKHLHELPIPPSSLRDDIPSWLNGIIMRLLEKRPEHRPQSARAILEMIGEEPNHLFMSSSTRKALIGAVQEVGVTPTASPGELAVVPVASELPPESTLQSVEPPGEAAYNEIIFSSFPTGDEIKTHESRVMQTGRHRVVEQQELAEENTFTRLERTLKISGIFVLGILFSVTVILLKDQNFRSSLSKHKDNLPWSSDTESSLSGFWGTGRNVESARAPLAPLEVNSNFYLSKETLKSLSEVSDGEEQHSINSDSSSNLVFKISYLLNALGSRDSTEPLVNLGIDSGQESSGGGQVSNGQLPSRAEVQGLVRFSDAREFTNRYPAFTQSLEQIHLYDTSMIEQRGKTLASGELREVVNQRLKAEQALSIAEWRIGVATRGLSNEAAQNETRQAIEQVDATIKATAVQLSGEKLKYSRWYLLRQQMKLGDILGIGQLLSAADGVVADKKAAYDRELARYKSAGGGETVHPESQATLPALQEIGQIVAQRRDELHDAIWSVIEGGLRRQLSSVIQFAGVIDILSRQREELLARRELLLRISEGTERRLSREALKIKRDELYEALTSVGSNITAADLRAVRVTDILASDIIG